MVGAINTSSITPPSSLLSITGNVSVLPYNSNTTLTAYTVKCNAVQCLGQITAHLVVSAVAKGIYADSNSAEDAIVEFRLAVTIRTWRTLFR